MSIVNIISNGLRPSFFPVMVTKLFRRLDAPSPGELQELLEWCANNVTSCEDWAATLDFELWQEALNFEKSHQDYAIKVLSDVDVDLGGGGHYGLLYFLVRYYQPHNILETGVAAGHSSRAMLTAISANGFGHLWSSDFPYFRLRDPEAYVGILVENALHEHWTLETGGDSVNIPRLVKRAGLIDLFHYDSDKSVAGRKSAWGFVKRFLGENAISIFDDIQDNRHFRELVASENRPYKIFEFNGKYLGIILPKVLHSNE